MALPASVILVAVTAVSTLAAVARPERARERKVLVFTRTTGFRHDSIPEGIAAVRRLGQRAGFSVDATEDPAVFADRGLGAYDAVVFVNTTGDVLDEAGRRGMEGFIRSGRGFVGVHSAADTEHGWPWYGGLVGAYFRSHPAVQPGRIRITDAAHAATRRLPLLWERTDEWYDFQSNPRGRVHVLATLDETSYSGGGMGPDHPIAWCQFYDGGRSFYTAGGHTKESYSEPLFLDHLLGGIVFAAGYVEQDCRSPRVLAPRAAAP